MFAKLEIWIRIQCEAWRKKGTKSCAALRAPKPPIADAKTDAALWLRTLLSNSSSRLHKNIALQYMLPTDYVHLILHIFHHLDNMASQCAALWQDSSRIWLSFVLWWYYYKRTVVQIQEFLGNMYHNNANFNICKGKLIQMTELQSRWWWRWEESEIVEYSKAVRCHPPMLKTTGHDPRPIRHKRI